MSYKLYFDFMSPPSRALLIILKKCKVPFEGVLIQLHKGEHLTSEYSTEVSRFRKVPVLKHDGFILTESIAMLRYLQRETGLLGDFYPEDSKKQARVDEFLEWQHNNCRIACAMYFYFQLIIPRTTGTEINLSMVNYYRQQMEKSMDILEKLWIQDKPFINGDRVSAADIFAICDIYQARMAGYDARKNRPVLSAWMDHLHEELKPYLDEVNVTLNKIIRKNPATN